MKKIKQVTIFLMLLLISFFSSLQNNSAFYLNTSEQISESDWSILISNSTYATYAQVKDVKFIPDSEDFIALTIIQNETGGYYSVMRFNGSRSLLWMKTFNSSRHGLDGLSVTKDRVYYIDSAYNESDVMNVFINILDVSTGDQILAEKLYDYRFAGYAYTIPNPDKKDVIYCALSLNSSVIFTYNNTLFAYNTTSKSILWNYTIPYFDKYQVIYPSPLYDIKSNAIYLSTIFYPSIFSPSNSTLFKIEANATGNRISKKIDYNSNYNVYINDIAISGDNIYLMTRNTSTPITENSLPALVVLDKNLNILATHFITPNQIDMVVYTLDVANNGSDVIIGAVIESDLFTAPDGYAYDTIAVIQFKLWNNSQNLDLVKTQFMAKKNTDMNLYGLIYNQTTNSIYFFGYLRNFIPGNYTGFIIKYSNFVMHSPPLDGETQGTGDQGGNPPGTTGTKEWTLFIIIFALGFLIGGSIFYSASHKDGKEKKSKRKSKNL